MLFCSKIGNIFLGSRVPFNTLTGVLDGNTVYGKTDLEARKLREGFGGLLRMNPAFREYGLHDLLPLKLDIPDEGCTRPNKSMFCFEAGEELQNLLRRPSIQFLNIYRRNSCQ